MAEDKPRRVLKTLAKLLEHLNLFHKNDIVGARSNLAKNIVFLMHCSIMLIYLYNATEYCAQYNFSITKVSGSLCLVVGIFQMLAIYMCLMNKRSLIMDSLNLLDGIVHERDLLASQQIYAKIDQFNTKLMVFFNCFAIMVTATLFITTGLLPICYAIFGFPEPTHWMLPIPVTPTMNPATTIGFFVSWFVQFLEVYTYFILFIAVSLMHIGFCSYPNAIVQDFQMLMTENERFSLNLFHRIEVQWHNEQVKAMHITAVQLHIKLIRLMDNLTELLNEALFIQLLSFVIFIALCLFSIDRSLENFDFDAMLRIYCLIAQTMFNSVFSYYSDNARDRSQQIAQITYNVQWYIMPLKQREFIRFIILRAQKPLIITGANIFPSSVETMATLTRTACSFYILFCQFK